MSWFGRSRQADPAGRRRGGPSGEAVWWDPVDQGFAEAVDLRPRVFGTRWRPVEMVNNAERLEPFPDHPDTSAILAAREARGLTALDEGRAWRGLRPAGLAVLRVEVFGSADDVQHRAAWASGGPACLEATWRDRWAERGHAGGWVEAVRRPDDAWTEGIAGAALDASGDEHHRSRVRAAGDWIRVEDHTDLAGTGAVTVYEYLTVWRGRTLLTLTLRHDLDDDLDDAVVRAAVALHEAATPPVIDTV